ASIQLARNHRDDSRNDARRAVLAKSARILLSGWLPVLAVGCETNWTKYDGGLGKRSEFEVGKDFLAANGFRSFWLFAIARWACIPFVLLGGAFCWRWAHELYGPNAGLASLALWCFCPNVLGHGALLTPDGATTSLGVAAAYTFWRWLRASSWSWAWLAGLILGLAELAKTNWIVLFPLWPFLWVIWRYSASRGNECRPVITEAAQLGLILALSILVINAGYGFDGTFKPLGRFEFQSRTLRGDDMLEGAGVAELGNQFRHGWLASVPVPLPEQYVVGIDVQRHAVEQGRTAYLFGNWKFRGWWYYYLAAATVKLPAGVWILLAFAIGARLGGMRFGPSLCDEIVLLAPAVATLVFVSSQTGINRHFRYALPIFPFLYVWLSSLALHWSMAWSAGSQQDASSSTSFVSPFLRRAILPYFLACAATLAWSWAVTSSILVYPHSLSYFNEIAGGPRGGPHFLLHSNTDWGQDLLLIKKWIDDHPEARPIYLNWPNRYLNAQLAGIDARPPSSPNTPGWHIISVNELYASSGRLQVFRESAPRLFVGGSTAIFHVQAPARRAASCRFNGRIESIVGLQTLNSNKDLGSAAATFSDGGTNLAPVQQATLRLGGSRKATNSARPPALLAETNAFLLGALVLFVAAKRPIAVNSSIADSQHQDSETTRWFRPTK
ncbi:MAG: glycosyltransferase family 39 protein, partial [Acidobacteriales bacterium]|nr:glycosyltransferase family 39 protein [Terriglobales bacterium]